MTSSGVATGEIIKHVTAGLRKAYFINTVQDVPPRTSSRVATGETLKDVTVGYIFGMSAVQECGKMIPSGVSAGVSEAM